MSVQIWKTRDKNLNSWLVFCSFSFLSRQIKRHSYLHYISLSFMFKTFLISFFFLFFFPPTQQNFTISLYFIDFSFLFFFCNFCPKVFFLISTVTQFQLTMPLIFCFVRLRAQSFKFEFSRLPPLSFSYSSWPCFWRKWFFFFFI